MALASINTRRRQTTASATPIARAVPFIASTSMMVLVPIWQPDALLQALAPLGYFDASIAVWITVFAFPLIVLITLSGVPFLRARKRHVGDFAGIDATLGSRLSTLAGSAQVVDYIASFALAATTAAFVLVSMWPALMPMRTPLAVCAVLLIAMFQTLRVSRFNHLASLIVLGSFVLILFLTAGLMGSSQYFSTTSSSDLAIVSSEVTRGTPFARGIIPGLMASLAVVLAPVLLLRHLTTDLSTYHRPRYKHAGTAQLVVAVAGSLVAITAMANIADVDSGTYIGRRYTLYTALRAVGVPEWLLIVATIMLLAVAITAARTVLDDADKLSAELTNFHVLPNYLTHAPTRRALTPMLYAITASGLVIIGDSEFRFIVPTLVISGFISLSLSRWSTMRYWSAKLRLEGHSRERITMKRSRLMAIIGLVISVVVLVALFAADMFRGAWIVAGAILLLYVLLYSVRRHYLNYGIGAGETTTEDPIVPGRVHYMIVAQTLGPVLKRATRWIESTRPYSIELLHVDSGGDDANEALQKWREEGIDVDLTILEAGEARPTQAVIDHVRRNRNAHPNRLVNVVLPQVVFRSRMQARLHNNELQHLQKTLMKEPGVLVTLVPWVD
ncbi:MAG: hypothetical protein Q4D87_00960 [Actinomycetaceae bacterium]|nr:hypothetical protein [Actinomycetaceae bacterium]